MSKMTEVSSFQKHQTHPLVISYTVAVEYVALLTICTHHITSHEFQ